MGRCTTPQSAQPTAPLKGKAAAAAYEGAVRAERMNPFPTKFVAAAAAIELHLIRRKRHLPLKGKAEKITTPQWRTTAALLLCNITNSYNKRLSKCSKL